MNWKASLLNNILPDEG